MDLFKGIAIFVGWLTSSLAGIGAIFYACGYLVVRAQLNMLGLFGLFEYPKEHYLQEGGKFFTAVTVMLIGNLLPRLVLLLYVLALISIIVLVVVAACFLFRGSRFLESCRRMKSTIYALPKGWSWLWHSLLLFCFGLILVFYVFDCLNSFAAVLAISNLLYGSPERIIGGVDSSLIIDWLLQGNSQQLKLYFIQLLNVEVIAVLLLAAAWHATSIFQKVRLWLVFPFIIVSILYTIFIPMTYGILVRPTKYAVVSFNWKDRPIASAPSGFYLLNKSEREFVLWDPDNEKVLCVSRELVWGTQVRELRPLFRKRDKNE